MVETGETFGILNSAVSLVASLAATEAMKMLIGGRAAERLRKTLWSFDAWKNEHAEIAAGKPRAGCRTCGERDFVHLAGEGPPHIPISRPKSGPIHHPPP